MSFKSEKSISDIKCTEMSLSVSHGSRKAFDPKYVYEQLELSLQSKDDVILDHYIKSYVEINKFIKLLGTVFSFVAIDVKTKLELLYTLSIGENGSNFTTIRSMLEFEVSRGIPEQHNHMSGSRALLKLHRGLAFIREFLSSFRQLQPTEKTRKACQESYDKTLAQYHSWVVRKAAYLAMLAMPTRDQLLQRSVGTRDEDVRDALNVLPEIIDVAKVVYDRTQRLYERLGLGNLT